MRTRGAQLRRALLIDAQLEDTVLVAAQLQTRMRGAANAGRRGARRRKAK